MGDWRINKTWKSLAEDAGFNEKYFTQVYSYLCGDSHFSYISALQVGQAQSFNDQKMLTDLALQIGNVIMAHFSHTYSEKFKNENEIFCADPAVKQVAKKWHIKESLDYGKGN